MLKGVFMPIKMFKCEEVKGNRLHASGALYTLLITFYHS